MPEWKARKHDKPDYFLSPSLFFILNSHTFAHHHRKKLPFASSNKRCSPSFTPTTLNRKGNMTYFSSSFLDRICGAHSQESQAANIGNQHRHGRTDHYVATTCCDYKVGGDTQRVKAATTSSDQKSYPKARITGGSIKDATATMTHI